MKRTVEMAEAGAPSAKPGCTGLIAPNRYGRGLGVRHRAALRRSTGHRVPDYGARYTLDEPVKRRPARRSLVGMIAKWFRGG